MFSKIFNVVSYVVDTLIDVIDEADEDTMVDSNTIDNDNFYLRDPMLDSSNFEIDSLSTKK